MSECYGHAIRSYGFALQSGRVTSTNQLNGIFLSKCLAQIAAAGDAAMSWSDQSAYGTGFPAETKAVRAGDPPSEVMLQWEHRAYWGANSLTYGTDGTASRHYMGPLPALGQWVQLKVPAKTI